MFYDFTTGAGSTVYDRSVVAPALDLAIIGVAQWHPEGLELESGIVRAVTSAGKIHDACQASDEVTLEAWVTTSDPLLTGPARLITLSQNAGVRDFLLGQGTANDVFGWSARLRTDREATVSLSQQNIDNGEPELRALMDVETAPTHVVFAHHGDGQERLYVDGVVAAAQSRPGTFSTWVREHTFALGNEITEDRPWAGTFHLVAVYCRALTSEEVEQNLLAGPHVGVSG